MSRVGKVLLGVAVVLVLLLLARSWYWRESCPIVVDAPSITKVLQICAARESWGPEGFFVYADLYERRPEGGAYPRLLTRQFVDYVDVVWDMEQTYSETRYDASRSAFVSGGRTVLQLCD